MKTYTRKANAQRAAIKAGIPKEKIVITEHNTGNVVRYGYAAQQPLQAKTAAANSSTAATPRKRHTAPHSRPQREERNGVKRPAAGGLCAAVWEYLDANPSATAKQVREAAVANAWNTNNALCELYTWRKFAGISGRVK